MGLIQSVEPQWAHVVFSGPLVAGALSVLDAQLVRGALNWSMGHSVGVASMPFSQSVGPSVVSDGSQSV